MRVRSLAALVCTLLVTGCISLLPGGGERINTGWTGPLEALGLTGTVESLAEPRSWRVKQVSSYDRTGGNADDRFAQETFYGGLVLADLEGPGCVLRIWTRNPWGTLSIFVDDMIHPVIVTPFASIFTNEPVVGRHTVDLFSAPLTGQGNGGYYAYVPIPYKERCRLVVQGEEDLMGYQVTYAEFPVQTPLRSLERTLAFDDVQFFKRWKKAWTDRSMRYHDSATEEIHSSKSLLWPQSNSLILPIQGPGVITEIEMTIEAADPKILRELWLVVYFDGNPEPAVLAPIGDFFGRTAKAGDYQGLVLGNDAGRMWCRYPMPFSSYAEIRVVNKGTLLADFKYTITWRPGPIEDQYHFFARYNSGRSVKGQPYRVAELSGQGHFAGCVVSVANAPSLSFLEGDDVLLVDGEPASNFHGTGTDDYFNAGWHFSTGPFFAPTHGNPVKIAGAPSEISAFRTHVTEAVPFSKSFVFELAHGSQNEYPGIEYSSVAYWYQSNPQPKTWAVAEFNGGEMTK